MSVDDNREDKELFRRGIGFLRQARPLSGLSPGAFERVERKLQRPVAGLRRRPLLLAAAVLCLVLLTGTAFAVANGGLARLPIVGPWFAPKPTKSERKMGPRRSHVPAKAAPAPTVPVATDVSRAPTTEPAAPPTEDSVPSDSMVAAVPTSPATAAARAEPAPKARRRIALARPTSVPAAPISVIPAPTAVTPAHPILDESRSFAAAIERWHRERDGSAALAALDEHDRRFFRGRLQMESRLLRAEILLTQGREREALAMLDQVTIAGSPRARELFTVRGELRIKLGQCHEGRADLAEVLAKGMADAFARRATEALRHCP